MPDCHPLLSACQMRAAEQYMITHGLQSYALMQRAGEAVAAYVASYYKARKILVLCGTGNNGGDGFILAQNLLAGGENVSIALWGEVKSLKGDAAKAAAQYKGKVIPLAKAMLNGNPLIIDALFGAGLTRPVEGAAAQLIHKINATRLDVIAVDIPSGVQGDTGEILGVAISAAITLTFAYKKYAHVLMPGRIMCGEVIVADIGVSHEAIALLGPLVQENQPALWHGKLPWPKPEHHKYHRGHVLVIGGGMQHAGAAKLAALAALRVGAGLVSIVCDKHDLPIYAATALSLITETQDRWKKLLEDTRINTVLIGPGAGVNRQTRMQVLQAFKARKQMVLDADALTSFADDPQTLFNTVTSPCIVTPHAGEFARIFKDMRGSKIERTLQAARMSHAVVVFKGFDTVIAAPDGRVAVNTNAPATLATAGAGDVLSGICAGLLAQGMEAFDAACAAAWMHGEAAKQQGEGLIAEDLPQRLPSVLHMLKIRYERH